MSDVGVVIRRAKDTDAESIFALKRYAFGDRFLLYTIYQAQQSINMLRSILERDRFVVIEVDADIAGYYHAVRKEDSLLLNYIVTAEEYRGSRFGTMLFENFTDSAKDDDCAALELDVFASNSSAIRWYSRLGFNTIRELYISRLQMTDILPSLNKPVVPSGELASALNEECRLGCSKICCMQSENRLEVGLIAGHTCKLLNHHGLSEDEAMRAITALFPERQYLIRVSSEPPRALPSLLTFEKLVRMRKMLG